MTSWVEAFRYVTARDLIAQLRKVPPETILYQSPVTAALVCCDRLGDDVDMSDTFLPVGDQPVMTPPVAMRATLHWYDDGSCGFDVPTTEPGWWTGLEDE